MTTITERVRAVRSRIAQRRADRPTKAERARKRAEANTRRVEQKRKYGSGGQDGGMGG